LSVAYIGPKSITNRPRKTKIGTEVASLRHMRLDTTFKVKGHNQGRSDGGISLYIHPKISNRFVQVWDINASFEIAMTS